MNNGGAHLLSDIRAIDITGWFAGPVAARTLADFGADVIRIEEPGAEMPAWFPNMHIETNRGKRHVLLDLKDERGRAIFLQLVASVDVLVENAKRGVWEKYGLGFDDLVRINPHLVYVSIKAYGSEGPWQDWGGFEASAQTFTGIGARMREAGETPSPLWMGAGAINDYGAPSLVSPAMLLALRGDRQSSRPIRIESALAHSATLYQSADLISMDNHRLREHVRPGCRGRSLLSRAWPASDGWVYALFPNREGYDAFARALELQTDSAEEDIEELTRQRPSAVIIETVRRCGGVGAKVATDGEVKARLQASGAFSVGDQPEWGNVGWVGPTIAFKEFSVQPTRFAPGWGEHTREVLAETGLSPEDIQRLVDEGVAQ